MLKIKDDIRISILELMAINSMSVIPNIGCPLILIP